jgi:hypothetical protein
MIKMLQQNLEYARAKMKKFAAAKRSPRTFVAGDVVYLKMQTYHEKALGLENTPKLASKYYGPFRVFQKIGILAYKLQLPPGTLLHDVFHDNQLKKQLGPPAVPNATLPMLTPQGKLKINPQDILEI